MSTKLNPGRFNCHAAAYPDEPIFTLLGRDPAAPATINFWRAERARQGKIETQDDTDRLIEAKAEAEAFTAWRKANLDPFGDGVPTWRLPHTVPEGNPIRVEPAAMEISVRAALMGVVEMLNTVRDKASVVPMIRRVHQIVDALDDNIPCVPSHWDVGAAYDAPEDATAGERMVIDSHPEDLAHKPEVPPHRFSMFNKGKGWAYARGLEINPSHLPDALDAMEADGWELVSLFGQTESDKVGFIFKRKLPTMVTVNMSADTTDFQEQLRKVMETTPAWPRDVQPVFRSIYPSDTMATEYGTYLPPEAVKFTPPKIEVHIEGMSNLDALSLMAVLECRMRWLPQDYEQVQIVGLIGGDPEAAFDFVQHRGRLEQRKTLIGDAGGCTEYGRQLEG